MLAPLICLRLNRLPNLLIVGSALTGIAMMLVVPSANAEESQGITNYRGTPTGIALSADGRSVAIASKTIAYGSGDEFEHGGGIVVIDVESGRVRLVRDYPSGEISQMAFSPDGKYIALVRTSFQDGYYSEVVIQLPLDASSHSSAVHDVASPNLSGDITAISYDHVSHDRVLVFSEFGTNKNGGWNFNPPTEFSLNSIDFDGTSGAVTVFHKWEATSGTLRYPAPQGTVTQLDDWMSTSISRSGADGLAPDFYGIGPAWIASDKTVHMIGGQSIDVEATFAVGKRIKIEPFHVDHMLSRPHYFGPAPDDLRYTIGVVDRSPHERPEYQDLYLYKRDHHDSFHAIPLARGDGGILSTAVSGDGRRVAFISIPLEDADPQPVLKFVDLGTEYLPSIHETGILAKIGVGRTLVHGRMTATDLLERLQTLLQEPSSFSDAKFIERTLGVTANKLPWSHENYEEYAIHDTVWGNLITSTYKKQPDITELELALVGGPCLTKAKVKEKFGEKYNDESTVFDFYQSLPRTNSEYSINYTKENYGIIFNFEYLNCAQSVSLNLFRK